ncbi:MAG TPA: hypothetical protein VFW44_16815 [Bryobacteraceae bacterium]|nr:hypothetical protein [Bryobacteraceae bacterium]
MALAQVPPPEKPGRTPPTLVLPVPGAPLSAEMTEERVVKNANGTAQTETRISRVFRDEAGRVREEQELNVGDELSRIIIIRNQPDGFMALLVPSQRMGGRFALPKVEGTGFGIAFLGGPLINVPGEKSVETENLGKQTLDGIEYEGHRVITTSKEHPTLVGTEEHWFNKGLGLFASMKSSGPDEESAAKLTKLDRRAPDPALFQIPADYVVQDLKENPPPH